VEGGCTRAVSQLTQAAGRFMGKFNQLANLNPTQTPTKTPT